MYIYIYIYIYIYTYRVNPIYTYIYKGAGEFDYVALAQVGFRAVRYLW